MKKFTLYNDDEILPGDDETFCIVDENGDIYFPEEVEERIRLKKIFLRRMKKYRVELKVTEESVRDFEQRLNNYIKSCNKIEQLQEELRTAKNKISRMSEKPPERQSPSNFFKNKIRKPN